MSKFFKIVFSRFFISAVLLLLQAYLIVSVAVWANRYYVVFQLASTVLGTVFFLFLINRKEPYEFKLAWMVLFLIFPVFGITMYALFAGQRVQRRYLRRIEGNRQVCEPFVRLDEDEDRLLKERLGTYYGIERYLQNSSGTHGYLDNDIVFYPVGEDFFNDLLTDLKGAEKFIFMEYFIIEHGRMWDEIHRILVEKAESGVEVRLMYDDFGSLGKIEGNYHKRLRKEGIQCEKFNPMSPIVSGIFNNRDHRKITVIDGTTGYTGGVNLGDEYINENHKLGHWKDTAIRVRGSAVRGLTSLFLQLYSGSDALSESCGRYFPKTGSNLIAAGRGYVNFFGDGPKPAYREYVGEGNYINMIECAQRYVYISTPYLITDYSLESALRNAALRGVDVRIVTPHIPDKRIVFTMTRSNYAFLMDAGVRIYEYTPGFIHEKALVCDDRLAFVGTINLDYRSLVHHFECGAVLVDAPCISDIKSDFDHILEVSQEIPVDFRMPGYKRLAAAVVNLFSPML